MPQNSPVANNVTNVPAATGDSSSVSVLNQPPTDILAHARQVLQLEAEAISAMSAKLDKQFARAIELMQNCTGKVIVTGMGKSGHVGNKIASTFASTGTPSFFVHPAELRHGDFGMLEPRDLVIALSGSGETAEIKLILDPIKRLGIKIISLTGNKTSTLAKFSDAVLDVSVTREACPLNLAPTTSTTATLAMGDALAVVLMTRKNFRVEDYAQNHPGGSLGRQLVTVAGVMLHGSAVPSVGLQTNHADVLTEITDKQLGFTSVCDAAGRLAGIITDGDLRRAVRAFGADVFTKKAEEIMTRSPKTISSSALAAEALNLMQRFAISDLLIIDDDSKPIGLIDLKDLLRAGII